jgi:Na+/glutamate symporter
MSKLPIKKNDNRLLLKYAGLATQLFIALGLAVYVGIKIDGWLVLKNPIFVWVLPVIVIATIIYKVIKDTSPKK